MYEGGKVLLVTLRGAHETGDIYYLNGLGSVLSRVRESRAKALRL